VNRTARTAHKTKTFEEAAAEQRLLELGLHTHRMLEVIRRGEHSRMEATPHDPINAGALDAYRYRVRAFRDLYVPDGWTVDHAGGLEKTWSPDRAYVVITKAGDEGVGICGTFPQPKRKPGNETRKVVENGTLLLDANWMNVAPKGATETSATWMLLVYRKGDVVRSELSWLTGMNDDDSVMGWYERILLPELDLTNIDLTGLRSGSPDTGGAIDVPVTRKR